MLLLWKEEGIMQEQSKTEVNENVKKSIIAIGQELIKRADDITNDLKFVANIEIYAKLTPDEITNFDVKKNYMATYEDKEEK